MNKKGIFISATNQHIGKTTVCLGLISGLNKRLNKVGFIKPVGQEHVTYQDVRVDKDVVLFKDHFNLPSTIESMSPVIFDRGFTRDYLDQKVNLDQLQNKISSCYQTLEKENDFVVVEGTGHVAVGSICDLNNAQVAKQLGLEAILIAEGGLGSSFDRLTLNKDEFEKHGVKVKGIILNKVIEDKIDMVENYMTKALSKWNIPLLGIIPFNCFLSTPSMADYQSLFKTEVFSGKENLLDHYKKYSLVACSETRFEQTIEQDQLIITPANREDIILVILSHYWDQKIASLPFKTGLILTGTTPPSKSIIEQLKKAHIPALYAPLSSYKVTQKISSHIAKIQKEDMEKIEEAKQAVESHINFDLLLN